ncbi:MAG: hypothetical protein ACFFCS_13570 [Candidatus Hodarchaeota archaeon]
MTDQQNPDFLENVKQAIKYLMKRQIGNCLVLSSYKVASVLKEKFGTDVNVSKVGRFISKFAKFNELERLGTNVPKFKIDKSKFNKLDFDLRKDVITS